MKDDRAAADYFQQAVKLVEDLRSSLSADQRERFFDVRIGGFCRTAPYEGLARSLMRLNRPIEAWKSSECTKARFSAEAMAQRSHGTRFDVPLDVLTTDKAQRPGLCIKEEEAGCVRENRDSIRMRLTHLMNDRPSNPCIRFDRRNNMMWMCEAKVLSHACRHLKTRGRE